MKIEVLIYAGIITVLFRRRVDALVVSVGKIKDSLGFSELAVMVLKPILIWTNLSHVSI